MHTPTSFDTVAHLVADSVFDVIPYKSREGATWQLPEETLARGKGDCEDRATLLASALIAAGISQYNVRVALGTIRLARAGRPAGRSAHAWVIYRSEDGTWSPLEPVPSEAKGRHADLTFEYEPEFVFNGDHKWAMTPRPSLQRRRRWNKLDPTFHGEVHKSIVAHAAAEAGVPEPLRTRLSRTFTTLFGNVIDNPDLRFSSYQPHDHFDSSLIDESWRYVRDRLQRFYDAPLTDSDGTNNLCWALHAIADFYAHSTYAHFLKIERDVLKPFDPVRGTPKLRYNYAGDPTFARAKLSYYAPWWTPEKFDRFARWRGRPVSGRYSFHGDSKDWIERITSAAPDSEFPPGDARQFAGSLPHHNEIAVDTQHGSNKLYADFGEQYAWRYHLALRHMVLALKKHRQIG